MLLLQVANYILWSLLLAAFHVCACAIVLKINSLPEESKPGFFMRLLFVNCTQLFFWLKLVQRCCCSCTARGVSQHSDISSSARAQQHTENLHMNTIHSTHEQNNKEENTKANEGILAANIKLDTPESMQNIVDKNAKLLKIGHTWNDVALGMNRLITTIYVFCNVLVFALYMIPLLFRVIHYFGAREYTNDTD